MLFSQVAADAYKTSSQAINAEAKKDVRAKSIGSNNAGNMAYATLEGLKGMMTVEKVAKLRGKTKEEILG